MCFFTIKEIDISKKYIIMSKENGKKKEQLVTIIKKYECGTFEYTYGKLNSNIGFCKKESLRNLNWLEKKKIINTPSDFITNLIEIF